MRTVQTYQVEKGIVISKRERAWSSDMCAALHVMVKSYQTWIRALES
jgi:hypothetical protein